MKLFLKYTEEVTMNKIKFLISFLFLSLILSPVYAQNYNWNNNLRTLFIDNGANIYTINIRTFGAKDYNKNDIIETNLGEAKGTFINAIPRLKELKELGINTVYLLPITKTGKLKALGTAGSLYAMDSFNTIDPNLLDETDFTPSVKEQAKKFTDEAHKLQMHVIVDLPSCGSYDMSLEKPELFLKDKNNSSVVPSDWTDVRLFKVYDDKSNLNKALVEEYKSFIDMVQDIGVDGIRADVAAIKPKEFWMEIINYARKNDPQFLFLAEASPKWQNPAKGYLPYASVEELLEAGFDGYYSDWSDLKEIKTKNDLYSKIEDDIKLIEKFENKKAYIANFATHDQVSPATLGYPYWQMVNWLNMTLPINPYTLDGFPAADTYAYKFQNKKAQKSYTDDDTYFVHKNKFDIFNFSRAPYSLLKENYDESEYLSATKLRYLMAPFIASKKCDFLKTDNASVFAFKKDLGQEFIIVMGNLDFINSQSAKVKVPKMKKDDFVMPFKMQDAPIAKNGAFMVNLKPFEIQVLAVKKMPKQKKN